MMTRKNACRTGMKPCNFDLKNAGRNVTLHAAIPQYHFNILAGVARKTLSKVPLYAQKTLTKLLRLLKNDGRNVTLHAAIQTG
jgi:hypothetical protein